ncbi:MAG: hypothetical protein ACRDTU_06085 [Micromonosporaceae bacterium]
MKHGEPATPAGASGATRRDTLRLLLGAGAAVGIGASVGPLLGPAAARAAAFDYTDPATFDEFHRTFQRREDRVGQSTDLNEWLGALAWGQSYIQVGMMRMYDATRDVRHLHELVDHIDNVLATRDSVRGVKDYRGLSLPAWRSGYPYTMGAVDLADASGRPILQVRSARTPIERMLRLKPTEVEPYIDVTVSAGATADRFKLTVTHRNFDVTEDFDNLSMDPASPDYVLTRVHAAWPTSNSITVKDLRESPGAGAAPVHGAFPMRSLPAVFGVHTGQIVHPIAWFARTVLESQALRQDRVLRAKAENYVDAAEAALAVHDEEWRENDRGEGWYVFAKGNPSGFDGAEQPANQFLAPGRAMLHLAAVTGKSSHADRVAKLARTFRNQLTVDPEQAYTWHYWPTWGRVFNGWTKADDVSEFRLSQSSARQIEDISHAHLSVDFAVQAFRDRVGFTGRDMRRLANTFTRKLRAFEPNGDPTVWFNVDGSFRTGVLSDELVAAGWMPIATWDEEVFTHCEAMYDSSGLTPDYPFLSGFMLMGVANLVWFARRG